jgi:SAM-dependent methyltransferase
VDEPNDVTIASYDVSVARYVEASPTEVAPQVAVLLDELAVSIPGGHVLELGSGPGREADYLERLGLRVDRTDATPGFVDALTRAGHEARVLDAREEDFGGPYDAILANAVLLHIERDQLESVLRSCHAATREGGQLVATFKEGDGEAWSEAKLDAPRWFVYWREQPLRAVLERAGWQVQRIDHVEGRLDSWIQVICDRDVLS